ncbi:MAG: S8 family peptidase, partial [Planctomycetota bacterium]
LAGVDDDNNGYIDDVSGWDFFSNDNSTAQDDFHGSHTAGTVGARGDNGIGVTGVNWRVKILPLRFIGPQTGSSSDAVEALDYAVAMGAKVSNNSWGGGGFSSAMNSAIARARQAGHIFVSSAGNNGDSVTGYPAGYTQDNIISVANVDNRDVINEQSSRGFPWVDIGAPGTDVLSLNGTDGYSYASGTSMAGPHVAGTVALLWSHLPGLNYQEVIDRVYRRARPTASMEGYTTTGRALDAGAALAPVWIEALSEAPEVVTPGAAFEIRFRVESDVGALAGSGPSVLVRDGEASAFAPAAVSFEGSDGLGDVYSATVTPASCGSTLSWYVEAAAGDGSGYSASFPAGGALQPITAQIETETEVWVDDFQSDTGWSVANSLADGGWNRGTPVGFGRADPIRDADGSGQCYLTDNVSGNSDVDNGSTTLTSPTIDASGLNDAWFGYARWFNNADGAAPNTDVFRVEISGDDGATWMPFETVSASDASVNGGWVTVNRRVSDVIAPTATMRLRFIASDTDPQSLVEAAVDAVRLTDRAVCAAAPAACNGADIAEPFGLLNSSDVNAFVAGFLAGAVPADLAEPAGVLNASDINAFVAGFVAGCP